MSSLLLVICMRPLKVTSTIPCAVFFQQPCIRAIRADLIARLPPVPVPIPVGPPAIRWGVLVHTPPEIAADFPMRSGVASTGIREMRTMGISSTRPFTHFDMAGGGGGVR